MSFSAPLILYALAALLIPILVHLFNFRKTNKNLFPSNRFLSEIKEQTSKKKKLKYYLILASRLLFLAFLIFAFTQPIVNYSENDERANNKVIFYLDNSQSMSNSTRNQEQLLTQGLKSIEKLTGLYPKNTKFKILTNSFDGNDNQMRHEDDVLDYLTELKTSTKQRTFKDVYRRLVKTEDDEDENSPADVYWISDFQKSTFGEVGIDFDSINSYNLISIEPETNSNIFVDSVFLKSPFLLQSEENTLQIQLANSRNIKKEEVLVTFFVNDSQVGSRSVSFEKNEQKRIEFPLNFKLSKTNRCKISINDIPVTFDNDHYFVLNKIKKISILSVINTAKSASIEKVFGNRELFDFSYERVSNLDYNELKERDVVVLDNLKDISQALLVTIDDFIEQGGTLVLLPSPDMEEKLIRQIGRISVSKNKEPERVKIAPPNYEEPFFSWIFESSNAKFDMPILAQQFQWSRRAGKALLSFNNQQPFLSLLTRGKGKIYLFASHVDSEQGALSKHAIYVPIMYKIAAFSKGINEPLSYNLDETILVTEVNAVNKADLYKLRNDQEEFIPEQRVIGKKLYLEIPPDKLTQGFYDLILDNQLVNVFALNLDKKESDLDYYSANELSGFFANNPNVKVLEAEDHLSLTKEFEASLKGVMLWRYCIIIALICLLIEIVLIRYL